MLIDYYLNNYHFKEYHSIRIGSVPEEIYPKIFDCDLGKSKLLKLLFSVKGMPVTKSLRNLPDLGFILLIEKPNEEIVYGIATTSPSFACCDPVVSPSDFINLTNRGVIKAVINFALTGENNSTIISTETRIWCGSRALKRKFFWYWILIRPFSGLVRRSILKQIGKDYL